MALRYGKENDMEKRINRKEGKEKQKQKMKRQ